MRLQSAFFRSIYWIWIQGTVLTDLTNLLTLSTLGPGPMKDVLFWAQSYKKWKVILGIGWGIFDYIPWFVPKFWGKVKRINVLRLEKFSNHSTVNKIFYEKLFWLCNQSQNLNLYFPFPPLWYPFPSKNCKICYGEVINILPFAK